MLEGRGGEQGGKTIRRYEGGKRKRGIEMLKEEREGSSLEQSCGRREG